MYSENNHILSSNGEKADNLTNLLNLYSGNGFILRRQRLSEKFAGIVSSIIG